MKKTFKAMSKWVFDRAVLPPGKLYARALGHRPTLLWEIGVQAMYWSVLGSAYYFACHGRINNTAYWTLWAMQWLYYGSVQTLGTNIMREAYHDNTKG